MEINVLISLVLWVVFLFALVILKTQPWKKDNIKFSSYGLAERNVKKWPLVASLLGSYIGGGTIIAFAGRVSTTGLAFIFAPIGIAIAFLLLGKFSKYYRNKSNTETASTPIDRFVSAYGERIRIPMVIIYILILLSFITVQLYAGSLLISQVIKITPFYASLIIVAIVLPYTWIGGSKGDVITDIAQILLIFFAVALGFFNCLFDGSLFESLSIIKQNNPQLLKPLSLGWGWLLAMIILPLFSIHTDGSIQQRLYLAKDDISAKKASYISALVYLFFGLFLIMIVLSVVSHPNIQSGDYILIDYALTNSNVIIKIGLSLAILSAILSTMDSQAILIGLIISNDIYFKIGKQIEGEISVDDWETKKGRIAKQIVPISIITSLAITIFLFNFNNIFLFLSGIWVVGISCFGAPLLALRFKNLKNYIFQSNLLVAQFSWSVILTMGIIIWQTLIGKDPVNVVLPFGVVMVFINALVLLIVGIIISKKNG